MPASTADIELSLNKTIESLTQILTFYSTVQTLSASAYASTAPRSLTNKLNDNVGEYQKACDELEAKVLKALAILERDARKASGLSPLVAEGDNVIIIDEVILPLTTNKSIEELPLPASSSNETIPTAPIFIPPILPNVLLSQVEMPELGIEIEDNMNDFLNDSLFAESTVTSPTASLLPLPLTLDANQMLSSTSTYPLIPNILDYSMIDLNPMNLDLGMDLDLSSIEGMDLDFSNLGDLSNLGNSGDVQSMSSEEIDELLRSLGGGTV